MFIVGGIFVAAVFFGMYVYVFVFVIFSPDDGVIQDRAGRSSSPPGRNFSGAPGFPATVLQEASAGGWIPKLCSSSFFFPSHLLQYGIIVVLGRRASGHAQQERSWNVRRFISSPSRFSISLFSRVMHTNQSTILRAYTITTTLDLPPKLKLIAVMLHYTPLSTASCSKDG